MSVKVNALTKMYGSQKAVDNISFEAHKGEVLGFLGPNGAGKSTTMKMITGFLLPTAGHISVCDIDVAKDPIATSTMIGYLPENNPLYLTMYVKEFLAFTAGLYKIKNAAERVAEMIELTGLQKEQHKQIYQLSKGYKQRVGLAQAMIHDPKVLILDEPTSGLDPNQLVEIRGLIQNLGREKTVIFSTHIMQEVQALCDRVIIINNGQLVADDPIDQLEKRISGLSKIIVEFKGEVTIELLRSIDGVKEVTRSADHLSKYILTCQSSADIRPDIFNIAKAKGWTILELQKENFSVEKAFQMLTGSRATNSQ